MYPRDQVEYRPDKVPVDEFLLDSFSGDEVEDLIAETFYGVPVEVLGEKDSKRRDNIFKYAHKMRKYIEHFELTHQTGDLGFLDHQVEWFLMDEMRIYADEHGVDKSMGYREIANIDGTLTVYPPFQQRVQNTVKYFREEYGLSSDMIARYEDLLVDEDTRVRFLLTLRQAFEKQFIDHFVEDKE